MLAKTSLMKLDQFTIKVKKKTKIFMEQPQKKKFKN